MLLNFAYFAAVTFLPIKLNHRFVTLCCWLNEGPWAQVTLSQPLEWRMQKFRALRIWSFSAKKSIRCNFNSFTTQFPELRTTSPRWRWLERTAKNSATTSPRRRWPHGSKYLEENLGQTWLSPAAPPSDSNSRISHLIKRNQLWST